MQLPFLIAMFEENTYNYARNTGKTISCACAAHIFDRDVCRAYIPDSKILNPLLERLASLGMMGDQSMDQWAQSTPFKPLNNVHLIKGPPLNPSILCLCSKSLGIMVDQLRAPL